MYGHLDAITAIAYGPRMVTAADINGDQISDIVTANYWPYATSVLLGNGDGSFQPTLSFGVGRLPTAVTIGDLECDGAFDLATANRGFDTISVLINRR